MQARGAVSCLFILRPLTNNIHLKIISGQRPEEGRYERDARDSALFLIYWPVATRFITLPPSGHLP